jgi:hypothetical protein
MPPFQSRRGIFFPFSSHDDPPRLRPISHSACQRDTNVIDKQALFCPNKQVQREERKGKEAKVRESGGLRPTLHQQVYLQDFRFERESDRMKL